MEKTHGNIIHKIISFDKESTQMHRTLLINTAINFIIRILPPSV